MGSTNVLKLESITSTGSRSNSRGITNLSGHQNVEAGKKNVIKSPL